MLNRDIIEKFIDDCQYSKLETYLEKQGIKLFVTFLKWGKHFPTDRDNRSIFKCTLKYKRKQYTFNFGQSIMKGNELPTLYEVLACLQKYDGDLNSFEDFCSCFGCEPIKSSEGIYDSVVREYRAMERIFGSELEALWPIC